MSLPASTCVEAVVGSPRPQGDTATVVRAALAELEAAGASSELIFPAQDHVRFCLARPSWD